MAEGYTKSTNYKVLDVRECMGDQSKTIVLICSEHNKANRRRIEVHPCFTKAYQDAQLLAPGDVILVHESYNKDGWSHHIDEIEF